MKKPNEIVRDHLSGAMQEITSLEDQLDKGHKVLDEIEIPRYDSKGHKLLLHERLSSHREQILDHLFKLQGLLEKYR